MNLDLSDEQEILRDNLAKLLTAHASPATIRAAEPLGFSPDLWSKLVDFGLPLMRAPASAGGNELTLLDACIVAEETGRYLAPAPVTETIVAARLLASIDCAIAHDWFGRVCNGTAIVTLALFEPIADRVQAIPAGAIADAILWMNGDALTLSVREPQRQRAKLGISPIAQVMLSGATVSGEHHVLAHGDMARHLYFGAVEEWKLLRAAALGGAAGRAIELAADYARDRKQFGQPIGSFQAVAHPLADSLADTEGVRLLVRRAVWAIARGRSDAAATLAMASWWAGVASGRAVQRALRTFGGYGLSLEYDIQLYFRWISALRLLAGDPADDLLQVGDRLWEGGTAPLPPPGEIALEIGFGASAERFAEEVRAFFAEKMTEELRAKGHHSTDGHDPDFHRQLATAGYAYPDWPREWGGAERSPFEVSALAHVFEEFRWTRVPIGITAMGARMLMMFGSPELQKEVLPRIGAGEALSCLGFSEPESGSDMYATQTRARRDGKDWVINGQKVFTTGAHIADYVLLLTRSDPSAKKHRGLTLFLLPMALPGIEVHPVHTLQDERTNITYFNDVRISDRYRLGEVDHGLQVMAAAMAQEHSGEGYHIYQWSLLDAGVRWASAVGPDDQRPMDNAAVRRRIARVAVHTHIADLLCRQAVWAAATGKSTRALGPMSKMFATETYMADATDLMELTAPAVLVTHGGALAEIEQMFRQSIAQTIYGGTSEIHRSMVAEIGLRLPRARN